MMPAKLKITRNNILIWPYMHINFDIWQKRKLRKLAERENIFFN